ncbi:MAG: hypothetical protein C4589_11525 [Peptococcaceae bacterium]|nr:MAG: hypothetical protein C4589_11525 [Peptococcaceae bacterium]
MKDIKIKIILALVLGAAFLPLIMLLLNLPEVAFAIIIYIILADIFIIIISVRLHKKFVNPYFKFLAFSYGTQLLFLGVWSLGNDLSPLPFVSIIPGYIILSWFTLIIPFLFIAYASLLYKESWERRKEAPVLKRLSFLVPAIKHYKYLVILLGVPLIYNVLRVIILFHFTENISNVYTGIFYIFTQTIIMFIMILVVMLNYSLLKIYKIKYFKYLFATSLLITIFSIFQTIYSLCVVLVVPETSTIAVNNFIRSLIYIIYEHLLEVYKWVIPALTSFALFTYNESEIENLQTSHHANSF